MVGPTAQARPMGGFNQGLGGFNDEHLSESAMQAALKQKQLGQQQVSTPHGSAKAQTNPLLNQIDPSGQAGSHGTFQPEKPREIGSLKEELVLRPIKDTITGLESLFDISSLLGISVQDSPEEKVKKQQMHQRWQKLDQEQQHIAQKKYQERMQQQKLEREQEEQKKQEAAARDQQSLAMPSSPQKGPVGPAGNSRKKKAENLLEQQRKGMSNVSAKN